MRAELAFFGATLDMAPRRRRRTLVVAIYAALAALMAALWYFTHWRGTGSYLVWAALLACRLFLGGHTSRGLIKPFNGKAPQQPVTPSPLLLLKLRIYPTVMPSDDRSFQNDERELTQRDRVHYLAYQAIGLGVIVVWFLASLRTVKPAMTDWIPMPADQLYFSLLTIVLLLFMTLPQAILLWTEPDMEEEI
jgi:hypothetical protein